MARICVIILCISVVIAQNSSPSIVPRKTAVHELKELERQNRITQQIFANYVERRLFPHRRPAQKPPTIDDILPKPSVVKVINNSSRQRKRDNEDYSGDGTEAQGDPLFDEFDDKDGDSEALQTVESEQHQYYPDGITADPKENEVESGKSLNVDWAGKLGRSKRVRGLFSVLENIATYNVFKTKQESFSQQIEPFYQEQYDNSYDDNNNQNENHFEKRDQDLYDARYDNNDRQTNQDESQKDAPSEDRFQSRQEYRYEQENTNPFQNRFEENDFEESNNETLLTQLENFVYSRFHCPNCVDDTLASNKWTMPLLKLGEKRYYLGIFFKANWFKAAQYCRFHGMHLASISSQEENDRLEKHIRDFGLGHEHFWISGTDLADEGNFFWMANGRPITFTNWNAGEPNNFRYENGEEENCLELWNRDGKGLKWNDSPCSFETYFVCEVQ